MRRIEFNIEQFHAGVMIADEVFQNLHPDQLKIEMEYSIQRLATVLHASLRLPGQKLPRTLVAAYPASWWDHIKFRLGWDYETVKVYREDIAVFPNLQLPPDLMRGARIFTTYRAEPASCFTRA